MARDLLTGVRSRDTLARVLQHEIEQSRTSGGACSILVLDLDYFKSINDAFGHTRGDAVLAEFGARLRAGIRRSDFAFRYGGDEFVLVLPGTPLVRATALGRRLLDAVRGAPFPGDPPLDLSISVGVATFPEDGADASSLFDAADRCLGEAKRVGRGRVVTRQECVSDTEAHSWELPGRLIEREEALTALRRLLDLAADGRTGALHLVGASGSGRSALLAEAEKWARMRGGAVVRLRPAQRGASGGTALERAVRVDTGNQPVGGRTQRAAEGLPGGPFPDPSGLPASEQPRRAPLLITAERWSELDIESRHWVEARLQARAPAVALVWSGTAGHHGGPALPEACPLEQMELAELTPAGVRAWMRTTLRIEPPEAFVTWLRHETRGLPAAIQGALLQLRRRGLLELTDGGWMLHAGYEALRLAKPPRRPRRRVNIPTTLTPCLGREAEAQDVLMRLDQARLVTLLGPGGVGKTRLALEVAAACAPDETQSVLFAALASTADAEEAPLVLANALQLTGSNPVARLKRTLGEARVLLILDNLEQMRGAGRFVSELLAAAPALRILATSRTALRVHGEHEFPVRPLLLPEPGPLPDLDTLAKNPAVAVFLDRARAVLPDLTLTQHNAAAIAQLVRALDGLPLALELAAARVRALSPQAILQRILPHGPESPERGALRWLTGGPAHLAAHQQTLRATLEWSWRLLSAEDQAMHRRVAVFQGSFTVTAAEAVLDPSRPPGDDFAPGAGTVSPDLVRSARQCRSEAPDVLGALERLLENSLLHQERGWGDTARLWMLETLREFALERLAEDPEQGLFRQRHAEYYLAFARGAGAGLRGELQPDWLARLDDEHENLRAALSWLLTTPEQEDAPPGAAPASQANRERALELVGALWRFWTTRGHLQEGRRWVERALHAGGEDPGCAAPARASAWLALGILQLFAGNFDAARAPLETSLRLSREAGDLNGEWRALNNLGNLASCLQEHVRSGEWYTQALEVCRQLGDTQGMATTFHNLGEVEMELGNLVRAEQFQEESLRLFREAGDLQNLGNTLCARAETRRLMGRTAEAAALLRDAILVWGELDYRPGIAVALHRCVRLAEHDVGLLARVQALAAVRSLREEMCQADGEPDLRATPLVREALDACGRDAVDEALRLGAQLPWRAVARLFYPDLYAPPST